MQLDIPVFMEEATFRYDSADNKSAKRRYFAIPTVPACRHTSPCEAGHLRRDGWGTLGDGAQPEKQKKFRVPVSGTRVPETFFFESVQRTALSHPHTSRALGSVLGDQAPELISGGGKAT